MSSQVSLSVVPRDSRGKQAAKRLRREGFVPAVVYGGDADPVPVSIAEADIDHILRHVSLTSLVDLTVESGETTKALIRVPVRHPISEQLIHVDILRVSARSRVQIDVPIELIGTPAGIEEGGVLDQVLHEVHIECGAMNIPEHLSIDISALGINDNVAVRDLEVPDGARMITDSDATIVTVSVPQLEIEEEVEEEIGEEEGAEPELIGHEDDDEEDEDDE